MKNTKQFYFQNGLSVVLQGLNAMLGEGEERDPSIVLDFDLDYSSTKPIYIIAGQYKGEQIAFRPEYNMYIMSKVIQVSKIQFDLDFSKISDSILAYNYCFFGGDVSGSTANEIWTFQDRYHVATRFNNSRSPSSGGFRSNTPITKIVIEAYDYSPTIRRGKLYVNDQLLDSNITLNNNYIPVYSLNGRMQAYSTADYMRVIKHITMWY